MAKFNIGDTVDVAHPAAMSGLPGSVYFNQPTRGKVIDTDSEGGNIRVEALAADGELKKQWVGSEYLTLVSSAPIEGEAITIPRSELPEVHRAYGQDHVWQAGGAAVASITSDPARFRQIGLAHLALAEHVEAAQAKAKADELAEQAQLREDALRLYAAQATDDGERLAEWELELLLTAEDIEKWMRVARVAKAMHGGETVG